MKLTPRWLFLIGLVATFPSSAQSQVTKLLPDEQNTVDVFSRTSPAVVHINAQQKLDLKYEDITPKSGAGTGFFFDREGHILTNFHVIGREQPDRGRAYGRPPAEGAASGDGSGDGSGRSGS